MIKFDKISKSLFVIHKIYFKTIHIRFSIVILRDILSKRQIHIQVLWLCKFYIIQCVVSIRYILYQVTSEWVKLFPSTITKSYTSSVTFMKQLTVIAISTLSYLKDIFPEDNYKMESFGGYNIRILKQTCSNELAQFLSTSLIHSFEAFDRRYVIICFVFFF